MIAAAKEGTIGLRSEGCLYLFHRGLQVILIWTLLGSVSPGDLLQTREELIVFRESLCHRTGGQNRQGDDKYGIL